MTMYDCQHSDKDGCKPECKPFMLTIHRQPGGIEQPADLDSSDGDASLLQRPPGVRCQGGSICVGLEDLQLPL